MDKFTRYLKSFTMDALESVGRRSVGRPPAVVSKVWKSSQDAAAFFVTVQQFFMCLTAGDLQRFFPDMSFCVSAYCVQQVFHMHILIVTRNVYGKEAVVSRLRSACSDNAEIVVTPVYGSVLKCVEYIRHQAISLTSVGSETFDVSLAGSYGNVLDSEQTGDRQAGLSRKKIVAWCSQGYPAYNFELSTRYARQAMQQQKQFYMRQALTMQKHYNTQVVHYDIANGDGIDPFIISAEIMSRMFGGSGAARKIFVYDVRSAMFPFTSEGPPDYCGQPCIILLVSHNYTDECAQCGTVDSILRRGGAFGNVEVLCTAKL